MVTKAILEHAEGKGLPFLGLQARKFFFFLLLFFSLLKPQVGKKELQVGKGEPELGQDEPQVGTEEFSSGGQ